MNIKKNILNKGFTLIELLVVISIISLLSSVVLVAVNGARVKARDAVRISDVKQLARAFQLYADGNNGIYPSSNSTGKCLGTATGVNCWSGSATALTGDSALNTLLLNYMPKIPTDPGKSSGLGDKYLYGDSTLLFLDQCRSDHVGIKGPMIIYRPEVDPLGDPYCKVGKFTCCGPVSCDHFCVYPIE